MNVHEFTGAHLSAAGDIALNLWGDEIPEIPAEFTPTLYQYLARYYYRPDSSFNLGITEDGELQAFLLAAPAEHTGDSSAENWMSNRLTGEAEKEIFLEYKKYLDTNFAAEQKAANPGEMSLLFFGSIRRGCGKRLWTEFEKRCHAHSIPSVILWTDDTCDFEYYYKNNFTEISRFQCPVAIRGHHFSTLIFRKQFA